MFQNILKLNKKIDEIQDREKIIENDKYKRLSFIEKRRINRINKLINIMINEIEKNTNYEYYSNMFIRKSNYRYDYNLDDILFDVDIIERSKDGYVSNDLEFNKYKDLLDRLYSLQIRKDNIYKKDNIIDYSSIKKISNNDIDKVFLDYISDSFINDFGIKGVYKLLSLLKDSEELSVDDLYDKVNKDFISKYYKIELLTWLNTFNKKGKRVFNKYMDNNFHNDSFERPNLEEIMTENIVKLL